jgi:hypothetical protein
MACAIIIFKNWTTYDTLWVIREVDITKWESLGFHVKIKFTTCLKIGPQGDTHPTLVKTHNIYIMFPTQLS